MDNDKMVERAKAFHETYERLAVKFGYTTRSNTRKFDPFSTNGKLMIAVMEEMSELDGRSTEAVEPVRKAIKGIKAKDLEG